MKVKTQKKYSKPHKIKKKSCKDQTKKINFKNLKFSNDRKLSHGLFGNVYRANNGNIRNDTKIVKKIKNDFWTKVNAFTFNKESIKTMFENEIKISLKLSKIGIMPKIHYVDNKQMIFVMDRLDYTLLELLKRKMFTPNHLKSLIRTLKKLQSTKFVHTDLHENNIMYKESNNRFYIIDWGIYKTLEKCVNKKIKCYNFDKENLYFLEILRNSLKKRINDNKWKKQIEKFKSLSEN